MLSKKAYEILKAGTKLRRNKLANTGTGYLVVYYACYFAHKQLNSFFVAKELTYSGEFDVCFGSGFASLRQQAEKLSNNVSTQVSEIS